MIGDFLNFLANGVFDFMDGFLGLLPQMPITAGDISQYASADIVASILGWVNYFLPINVASSIVGLWCTAMLAYVGLKLSIKYTSKLV